MWRLFQRKRWTYSTFATEVYEGIGYACPRCKKMILYETPMQKLVITASKVAIDQCPFCGVHILIDMTAYDVRLTIEGYRNYADLESRSDKLLCEYQNRRKPPRSYG
jgi:hypothetical protein